MRIDAHSHVIPEAVIGEAGDYGPELTVDEGGYLVLRVGEVVSRFTHAELQEAVRAAPDTVVGLVEQWRRQLDDPRIRLQEMDEAEIDVMGITVSPLLYLYWAESEVAIPFARTQNEALAKFCSEDPARLFFMATLPLQDPEASVAELIYAHETLDARAINLGGTNIAGRELDDPVFLPVFAAAAERSLPLFIHPYPDTMLTKERHPLGMDVIVGYLAQETQAAATLIYGGVLDKLPSLKVCITHGGGFLPYQFGRLKTFAEAKGSRALRPMDDYKHQLYFDLLVHETPARKFLVDFAGADHVFVGSNYRGLDSADGFAMLADLELPPDQHEQISSGTARSLFRLGGG